MNGPNVVVVREGLARPIGGKRPSGGAAPAGSGYSRLVLSLVALSVALCFYDLYELFAFATA